MKLAICNELFENWDFKKVVQFVSQIGYQGLEIAPFTIAESVTEISTAKRREIFQIAADHGIEITGLHWLLVKPDGLYINHPEQAIRQRTVDYMKHLIDFCADIGGQVMVFGSPNQRKIADGISYEQAKQYAVDSYAQCGDKAAERDVFICLEALPPAQTDFMTTNSEVLSVLKAVDHPHIQMMLDVKSMCTESISIPENIIQCQNFFRHVHANDANQRGPGFGQVDFRPIFQTLKQVQFDGFVSVEVFDYAPDPETIATKSLAYMKECL